MTLIHVIIIVYMTFGLAVQIKIRYKIGYGMEDSPPSLARTIRDYSPVLFIIPMVWAAFAFRRWKKNGTDLDESTHMMLSGISIAGGLLILAVIGTISASIKSN